jgi:hypothetical protein
VDQDDDAGSGVGSTDADGVEPPLVAQPYAPAAGEPVKTSGGISKRPVRALRSLQCPNALRVVWCRPSRPPSSASNDGCQPPTSRRRQLLRLVCPSSVQGQS